jgi:hypothetical protein
VLEERKNKVCLSPERGLPGEEQSRRAVAEARTTTEPTKNGDKHMKTLNKYVGLDVHKDTTVIAVAEDGRVGEVRIYGTISSDLHALEKALRKIGGEDGILHVVYEAGPTGYVVYRRLQQRSALRWREHDRVDRAANGAAPAGVVFPGDLHRAGGIARRLPGATGVAP